MVGTRLLLPSTAVKEWVGDAALGIRGMLSLRVVPDPEPVVALIALGGKSLSDLTISQLSIPKLPYKPTVGTLGLLPQAVIVSGHGGVQMGTDGRRMCSIERPLIVRGAHPARSLDMTLTLGRGFI